MPTFEHQRVRNVAAEDFIEAASFVREQTPGQFDIALEGATEAESAIQHIAPYAAAGLTWWVEALGWWRDDRADAATRIAKGPPTIR